MPGKLLTYITGRPSAAPLVPQPPDPHLRRLSLSGDTPYHEIQGSVENNINNINDLVFYRLIQWNLGFFVVWGRPQRRQRRSRSAKS
jgi:hypothetical protein